jgi:hypothetical protein
VGSAGKGAAARADVDKSAAAKVSM